MRSIQPERIIARQQPRSATFVASQRLFNRVFILFLRCNQESLSFPDQQNTNMLLKKLDHTLAPELEIQGESDASYR